MRSSVRRLLAVGVVAAASIGSVAAFTQSAYASGVSGVTVTPSPSTAGATSIYTIGFTTTTLLVVNNLVTLSGPAGTVFPLTASDYSVGGNTVTAPPTQTAVNNVTLTVPTNLVSLSVSVSASSVTNPSATGSYTMSVSTSIDTTPVASAPYGIGSTLTASGGTGQSARVGTSFGTPFSVTLVDGLGAPVVGTTVTFTAPGSGPSGAFSGGNTAVTNGSGVATSNIFTANGAAGVYNVSASVSGGPTVLFIATNYTLPGAPATSYATAGFQSAHVHWTPPASNGFSPVTGYLITASNGAQLTVAGNLITATFPGLTNNVSYTFTVAAINAAGTGPATPPTNSVSPNATGYWLTATDGGIFSFPSASQPFFGSEGGSHLNAPIVGMARTPDGGGYWLVASDGGIFTFGDAGFYGSEGNKHLNAPIVGIAATPSGAGYYMVASDGGIFTFGDAVYHGSEGAKHLNKPIVGMATTPTGAGYWLVASDGGIFSFGSAHFYGSTGGMVLNKPIVGMASPSSNGYWLVASDGGIFTFGTIGFYGSAGNIPLNKPIIGMLPTANGTGYWLAASDGGIFSYGNANFGGSTGGMHLNQPIVAIG